MRVWGGGGQVGPTGRGGEAGTAYSGLDHGKSTLVRGSKWDYTPLPF